MVAKRAIIGLIGGAACMALGGLFFYNHAVSNNHELAQCKDVMREREVKNAELKSTLYALTDTQHMQDVAMRDGLIIERNPNYVQLQQEVSLNR